MKKTYKYIIVGLPILISLIALFVSYLSYNISKQDFEYNMNKDMMINTPTIKEDIDSLHVSFLLNNENASLQGLQIIFPNEFCDNDLILTKKPIQINKDYLERLVRNYLREIITLNDSIIVFGEFSVPIIVDYSAVVYGFPQRLRENRFLIFEIHYCHDIENVTYSNSVLNGRCGYPLKRHYFYTGPFSKPLQEKVQKYDEKDVQELLGSQLKMINDNMR